MTLCPPIALQGHVEAAETAAGCARTMIDTQEFESFVERYQDMVFTTSMRLVARSAEAEDIAQEVFLKAYHRFAELRESPTAGGWLKTVATNLSLNHLSRYRSRWTFFSDLIPPWAEEGDPELDFASEEDLGEALASADAHKLVGEALAQLPPAQRVPLVLYHLEGLRYEEIAAKLGVSLPKVKTDIFRGREALRRRLAGKLGRTGAGAAGQD
jgi:RNA polymerase sigma-70 factor (ECF subfamily)